MLHAGDKSVSINDVSVTEGNSGTKLLSFTVTATDNVATTDTIDYSVFSGSATTADNDFIASEGNVTFSVGNTATISVTINGDTTPEADETFTVQIYNPVSSAITSISDNTGIGTIINDDTQAWPPIISAVPDQIAIQNIIYKLDISDYVAEVNGDTVTYNLSGNLPSGLIFNTSTGVLSGTPTANGTYDLNVTASDKDGYSAVESFTLSVDSGFCYEYSYKQQNSYFTESNPDNEMPYLRSGNRYIIPDNPDYPVEMSIYIRHRSSLDITDLNVSITDLNTSQVKYVLGTTTLTKNGILPSPVTDDASTTISNIYNVKIGKIDFGDYFYVDYDLNPKTAILDTPINANISFTVYGTQSYSLSMGSNIPLCSTTSTAGYTPVSAIFNVVHNDYYNNSTALYNLPTQVVKRVGSFKVIALEPDSDTLKNITTVPVAVELIDVDEYGGDVEAACQKPASAITPKVWIVFGSNTSSAMFDKAAIDFAIANGMTDLTNSSDFYKEAHKNVAFRTSYNYSTNDQDVIKLEIAPDGGYNISNFSDAVKQGSCGADIDGNPTNTDTIAQFCDNAGSASSMTLSELKKCMECAYGLSTKLTCSRDNFSIRPEAFSITLKDHTTALTSPANLAAGYDYNLSVTATTHIDNTPSLGYSADFTQISANRAEYKWDGLTAGCSDYSNKSVDVDFYNGFANDNIHLNQVGKYYLNLTDNSWTAVDSDPNEMIHHTGSYFLDANTPDCVLNSNITKAVNYSSTPPYIGCNISSSHTNSTTGSVFRDFNATFHPYKFDLSSINPSVGLNNAPLASGSFVYMSDMSKDEAMSFHLNGNIRASGFNDSNLSNFISGCYAKPIDINITKSTANVAYQYRFNTKNSSNAKISTTSGDFNNTSTLIQLSEGNFTSSTLGSINSNLNLNFNRTNNSAANPAKINLISYSVDCQNPDADCKFSADLSAAKTTSGFKSLEHNVTHYYGRTNASRQRYEGNSGSANIYYEIYCFDTINGNTCNKTLLPNGLNSKRTSDVRWFVNEEHNATNDGYVGTVIQKGANVVTATAATYDNIATTTLTYNGTSYPYKTTMENNASGWLIYNKDNPSATRNQFSVEFQDAADSGWSGAAETNTTTKSPNAVKTNRRSNW